MDAAFWERVGELAGRAPQLSDLREHRLQLVARSRMRARGETLPEELRNEELRCAAAFLAAPVLLTRIRALAGGRMVLMKGREASSHWANPRLRPFGALDLLVDD